jgi:hypothetical protein
VNWGCLETPTICELRVFKDPHYLKFCYGVGHHDTTMVVDGMMEGSLQRFMRETTASTELQPCAHWWSVPSPQLTPYTGATNGSNLKVVSMDQDDDTHEGMLEGVQDVYLDTGPVEGLPGSRLVGRHFMTKSEHRRRCKLCVISKPRGSAAYQSKISLVCKQCNVFLHFECFEEYHSRANPVSRWVGGA